MPYNLLLLPLLGGFLFLHQIYALRFRAQRLDGNRLLLESAAYGAGLLLAARMVVVLAGLTSFGTWCGNLWWICAPFPHSDSAAMAVVLGLAVPVVVNRFFPEVRARNWAIRKSGDSLTVLLNEASINSQLVSLTLTNLKWYVGYVLRLPNLKPQDLYVTLLPVISGYRDRDTLQTHEAVQYTPLLQSRPDTPISLIIPVTDIKTATQFDPDLYQDFFSKSGPADNNPAYK